MDSVGRLRGTLRAIPTHKTHNGIQPERGEISGAKHMPRLVLAPHYPITSLEKSREERKLDASGNISVRSNSDANYYGHKQQADSDPGKRALALHAKCAGIERSIVGEFLQRLRL